jgi:hypothetical protein
MHYIYLRLSSIPEVLATSYGLAYVEFTRHLQRLYAGVTYLV